MTVQRATILLLLCGALSIGCDSKPSPHSSTVDDIARTEIYSRAEIHFAAAVLFKPDPHHTDTNAVRFAPFIAQETTTHMTASGDGTQPTVFYRHDTIDHRGNPVQQFSYFWRRSIGEHAPAADIEWSGLRLTLDATGQPVIWETFGDSSGARMVFVAQSIETLARNKHGPPLPGRKFSVEPDIAAASEVIVARVIDDGPVPMGPIIHQRVNGDIMTLICRCMEPQFGRIASEQTYTLRPLTDEPLPGKYSTPKIIELRTGE